MAMEIVNNLINYLLDKQFSVDEVDSIVNHLKISKDDLLRLIRNFPYEDYFQYLRPSNNTNQVSGRIALTLDVIN